MKHHFCTLFDRNYVTRTLALHASLQKHCPGDFTLYGLCLDDQAHGILRRVAPANTIAITLSEIEAWDKELEAAKLNRSIIEYYFTLSPILPLFVLSKFGPKTVARIDADVYFFDSPAAIHEELGSDSILITEHRFPPELRDKEKFGRYAVQCELFRNDEIGNACLRRWRQQCLECCRDECADGKFADQKYLEEWPERYGRVAISRNPGVGVAPWNVGGSTLSIVNGQAYVGGRRLVFYHFHGLRICWRRFMVTGIGKYCKMVDRGSIAWIYREYGRELRAAENDALVGKRGRHDKIGRHQHWPISCLAGGLLRGDVICR